MTPRKTRYDLIPPAALRLIASVFTDGTKHDQPGDPEPGFYRVRDWGPQYKAALMRHFEAYREGEWLDPKSTFPHLAHVASNAMILLALELRARTGT